MEEKDFRVILEEFAKNVIADIRLNMGNYGLADSKLANSLTYEIFGEGGQESVLLTAADYWDYAQIGRGPGGVPYDFEDILSVWMSDRGISVDSPEQFIQNVKWHTIKHGNYLWNHPSEERNFVGDAIEKNMEKLSSEMKEKVKQSIYDGLTLGKTRR